MGAKPSLLLIGFGLLLTGCLSLSAQDKNEAVRVNIRAVDLSGAVIPHARVELAPQQATTPKNLETDEFGEISMDILPGNYIVYVTTPSFVHVFENMEVKAAADQAAIVTLKFDSQSHLVQVSSPPPLPLIETSPTPAPTIGLLPLPASLGLPLVQQMHPSVTKRSASARKRVPVDSTTPKNLPSSPST